LRKSEPITDVFITAESNRFPVITRNPPRSISGCAYGRITAPSVIRAASRFAATVRPETVTASAWSLLASSSSRISAGMPPAR
jgi:hypothetical protein